MTRIRARVAILALILVLPAAVAGCGGDGGGGGEDPSEVLDQTFNNPEQITSGQLGISLDGSAEGASREPDGDDRGAVPDRRRRPDGVPAAGSERSVSASGAGQSFDFEGGLIVTEDNAFVEYQGQAYEVGLVRLPAVQGRSTEQSARQARPSRASRRSSIFERFGIDPQTWLTNVSNEGDEDVEGTETIHIHGDADVEQIFSDLARIAERVPGDAAAGLDPAQLDQVKSAIQEASLDVYSGKDDQHPAQAVAVAGHRATGRAPAAPR